MKNLTLISNEWKKVIDLEITNEEIVILQNVNSTPEEIRTISEAIKQRSYITPQNNEMQQAQSIYDQNKIEGAELIGADISLEDGHGIINCRVNGEHKQIRF